jgi:hypothetical protein
MAQIKEPTHVDAREDRDQQLPDDRADPAHRRVGGLLEIVPLFFQKSTTSR